jgi:molecular chaperone DnaJ
MPSTRCYYEVLSVSRDASGDEIKRSYRRLAMKFHPDRNPDNPEAETKFKEAAEAYEVLSDSERRGTYDQFGREGLRGRPGHDFNSMRPDDIFSMFNDIFDGRGGGRRGRVSSKGYDLETEVDFELEDVLNGANRDVSFTRMDLCESCDGSGAEPGTQPETCGTCNGQGKVAQAGLGGMFRMVTACPACSGRGSVVTSPCNACTGRGRSPVDRNLSVRIPRGIHDGQAVRVAGEGEPPAMEAGLGGRRGDLHVGVRVAAHETFERDGNDLLLLQLVVFTQLALGGDIDVPMLGTDNPHTLHLKPGAQPGDMIRIKEGGLPDLRSGRRGDLVVILKLVVPRKLDDTQRQLLVDYAKGEATPVDEHTPSMWGRIKDAFRG